MERPEFNELVDSGKLCKGISVNCSLASQLVNKSFHNKQHMKDNRKLGL